MHMLNILIEIVNTQIFQLIIKKYQKNAIKIWNKIKCLFNKGFNIEPAYNVKDIKIKMKIYNNRVYTNLVKLVKTSKINEDLELSECYDDESDDE